MHGMENVSGSRPGSGILRLDTPVKLRKGLIMAKKVYVGNIPFQTSEEDLRKIFEEGGREVVSCNIITDRETGRSRGFGFVELGSEDEANSAIQSLDGSDMGGRPLKVNLAKERAPRRDNY